MINAVLSFSLNSSHTSAWFFSYASFLELFSYSSYVSFFRFFTDLLINVSNLFLISHVLEQFLTNLFRSYTYSSNAANVTIRRVFVRMWEASTDVFLMSFYTVFSPWEWACCPSQNWSLQTLDLRIVNLNQLGHVNDIDFQHTRELISARKTSRKHNQDLSGLR